MAHKQFSWTKERRVKTIGDLIALQHQVLHSKKMNERDLAAYRLATKIATEVLSDGYTPRYRFTHFHTVTTVPYWSPGKRKVKIGRHYFMRF